MNEEDFQSLLRGMADAKAYLAGEQGNWVIHTPEQIRARREKQGKPGGRP